MKECDRKSKIRSKGKGKGLGTGKGKGPIGSPSNKPKGSRGKARGGKGWW